jgi:MFS family permease
MIPANVLILAVFTFVIGLGQAFFQPAYAALVPNILASEHYRSGNALTALAQQIGGVGGPMLGGLLVAFTGSSIALTIDAATFLVSIAVLVTIKDSRPERGVRQSVLRESMEGVRAVTSRSWVLRHIAVGALHLLVAFGPVLVLLPVVMTRDHGDGAFGVVLSCFGIGSIAGSVVGERITSGRPGVIAAVGMSALGLALLSLAMPLPFGVVTVAFFTAGFGMSVYDVLWQTALQYEIPDELRGRVASLDWFIGFSLPSLGMALAGWADITTIAVVGGLAVLATAPLTVFVRGGRTMTSTEVNA